MCFSIDNGKSPVDEIRLIVSDGNAQCPQLWLVRSVGISGASSKMRAWDVLFLFTLLLDLGSDKVYLRWNQLKGLSGMRNSWPDTL